jgi:hypothetical protein
VSAGAGAPAAPVRAVRHGRRPALGRVPLLALGFVALVAGVGAGLARLGWAVPAAGLAGWHGPLMVCGFLGTVIAIERAVALGRPWAWAGPLLAGIGSVVTVSGAPVASVSAPALYACAAAVLLAASIAVLRRQPEGFNAVLALGAGAWTAACAAWAAGAALQDVVGGWIAFLVLTIAGERLELSRYMPRPPWAPVAFAAIAGALVVAAAWWPQPWAPRLCGVALVALAAWLARHDIARITVRQAGLTRFVAACLLSGYGWLAVSGATLAIAGATPGTPAHDAALHALFLGFVFSMVFGHAPIVFPAVLRIPVPYRARFYLPLVLLHASVATRLAGDALDAPAAVRWGALLSAVALAAFVAGTASSAWQGPSVAPARTRP